MFSFSAAGKVLALVLVSCAHLCSFSLKELKKYGVRTLVRVCEATYDQAPIEKEGIQVLVSCL